jgi:fatty acid desaturase
MTAATSRVSRAVFRDRDAAVANIAVLAWTCAAWIGSFVLMGLQVAAANVAGVLLCAHTMILAAYLIHEAAHQTLFAAPKANALAGEAMSFVAGASYASFERIRRMHLRHHLDRADLACFDFKALLRRRPSVLRILQTLEWAYLPAAELMMHAQVIVRPFFVASQRKHLPRVAAMLALRLGLLALLGLWSLKALLLYLLAVLLQLHVLNFFDAFHHTFEQYFVADDEPVPTAGRDRRYEQQNTYSNVISRRRPWLNLLTLNFGYHNAHHHRPSVPWYRLPALHRELYGQDPLAVLPLSKLLATWHRNRVRRVLSDDYGAPAQGPQGADAFVGAHGVSFLTVI